MQNFSQYFKDGAENPKGTYKTYIIRNTNAKDKIKSLTTLLDRHKIKYGLAGFASSATAYDYTSGRDTAVRINEKDLIISARQPMSVLTQVLFDPESELSDSLTYDITAWSLPLAYGLEAYASKQSIVATQPYKKDTTARRDIFRFIAPDSLPTPPYAYIAPWKSLSSARFLSHIQQNGVNVRVSNTSFEMDNKSYPAGTLVITRADNVNLGRRFEREVGANAAIFEQEIIAASTGFTAKGPDFGSDKLELMHRPSVALLYDDQVDVHTYGQVWYYFEQELHLTVTAVHTSQLNSIKLGQYNTIILPDGRYDGIDSGKLAKLHQWIADGGRLIAIGDALHLLEDKKGFELTKYATKKEEDAQKEAQSAEKLNRRFAHYEDSERSSISEGNPGAIVKVQMDKTHPLAYGMSDYYFSLKTGTDSYQPLKNAWNVGYTNAKLGRSGFIGSKLEQGLKNSAVFAVQNINKGTVVYMMDNPLFRCFWYQGLFLFGNAVFMPMD